MKERKTYKIPAIEVVSMDMQHDIIQTSDYTMKGLDAAKKKLKAINATNGLFAPGL